VEVKLGKFRNFHRILREIVRFGKGLISWVSLHLDQAEQQSPDCFSLGTTLILRAVTHAILSHGTRFSGSHDSDSVWKNMSGFGIKYHTHH
jgi:hypothetical protein